MSYSVQQFLTDCREIIHKQGLPGGLEDMRVNTECLLANPKLLDEYVDLETHTGHTVIGHDQDTEIYVIVHGGPGRRGKSPPHDHGPCSVIYGNYTQQTRMRRWRRLDQGGAAGNAHLEMTKDYMVHAGEATAFAAGDIHSIDYPEGTYFVRVTVGDVEQQKTKVFDVEKGTVKEDDRSKK